MLARRALRLAPFSLPLIACSGPTFEPRAHLEGAVVVIAAHCEEAMEIIAAGHSAACAPGEDALLKLPATSFGAGHQTIEVKAHAGDSDAVTANVALDIPPTALVPKPFFQIVGCPYPEGGGDHWSMDLAIDGAVRETGEADPGEKVDCDTVDGARAKVSVRATPKATLAIGGKTVTLPDGGGADVAVDFSDAMMGWSVDDLGAGGSSGTPTPIVVPWSLDVPALGDRKATRLEGKLTFVTRFGNQPQLVWRWLSDLAAGKLDHPPFNPPAAGQRKTIVLLPDDSYAGVKLTDHRGKVRDLAAIAVMKETGRTESGTCQFDSDGKTVVAKRFGVASEVVVRALADGRELGKMAFPAPEGCPSFAMLDPQQPETAVIVNTDDVMEWLETIAVP